MSQCAAYQCAKPATVTEPTTLPDGRVIGLPWCSQHQTQPHVHEWVPTLQWIARDEPWMRPMPVDASRCRDPQCNAVRYWPQEQP